MKRRLLPAAAAGTALAAAYGLCRYAFYSPRGGQNDDHTLPASLWNGPTRDKITKMIDDLNAVPYERVGVRSFDGLPLAGRYYHQKDGAPLQICFHGYRGTPSRDFSGGARAHLDAGYNVLLAEERAHCSSGGHYITMGVRERRDVLTWVEYAVDRFGPDVRIQLNGISMGAATVLMAAGLGLPENVRGVAADCPFTSPGEIVKKVLRDMHLPVGAVFPLMALGTRLFAGFDMYEADAAEAVRGLTLPILLIHGEADSFVPCDMSRAIAAANPLIELHTFPGAEHGVSYLADEERYRRIAAEFSARIFARDPDGPKE